MRKRTYKVLLKKFLKVFKNLACHGIHTICGWLNHVISSSREKEKKGENYQKACMGTLSYDRYPLIYRHLVCVLFIKTFIIILLSINIHIQYMDVLITCYLHMKSYKY